MQVSTALTTATVLLILGMKLQGARSMCFAQDIVEISDELAATLDADELAACTYVMTFITMFSFFFSQSLPLPQVGRPGLWKKRHSRFHKIDQRT